jgi:transposase
MPMLETTRAYRATILNHSQVSDDHDLDQCGFSASASKLWSVARHYTQDWWDEDGEIPNDSELKSGLKKHERYSDLHSQSTQQVLEELAESVTS